MGINFLAKILLILISKLCTIKMDSPIFDTALLHATMASAFILQQSHEDMTIC